METAHVKSTPHPIVLAAAASVIVFSAVGTAAVMGCSEGSVKTHCSRAVHALAKSLKAKGIAP